MMISIFLQVVVAIVSLVPLTTAQSDLVPLCAEGYLHDWQTNVCPPKIGSTFEGDNVITANSGEWEGEECIIYFKNYQNSTEKIECGNGSDGYSTLADRAKAGLMSIRLNKFGCCNFVSSSPVVAPPSPVVTSSPTNSPTKTPTVSQPVDSTTSTMPTTEPPSSSVKMGTQKAHRMMTSAMAMMILSYYLCVA